MIIVPAVRLIAGDDEVGRPSLSTGTATTVTMTDDERAAAAAREASKLPFGFVRTEPT